MSNEKAMHDETRVQAETMFNIIDQGTDEMVSALRAGAQEPPDHLEEGFNSAVNGLIEGLSYSEREDLILFLAQRSLMQSEYIMNGGEPISEERLALITHLSTAEVYDDE